MLEKQGSKYLSTSTNVCQQDKLWESGGEDAVRARPTAPLGATVLKGQNVEETVKDGKLYRRTFHLHLSCERRSPVQPSLRTGPTPPGGTKERKPVRDLSWRVIVELGSLDEDFCGDLFFKQGGGRALKT